MGGVHGPGGLFCWGHWGGGVVLGFALLLVVVGMDVGVGVVGVVRVTAVEGGVFVGGAAG